MTAREEIEATSHIELSHLIVSLGALEIQVKEGIEPVPGRFLIPRDLEITYKGERLPMSMIESLTLEIKANSPVRCDVKFAVDP